MYKFNPGDLVLVKKGQSESSSILDGKVCVVQTFINTLRYGPAYNLAEESKIYSSHNSYNTCGGVWEYELICAKDLSDLEKLLYGL